MFLLCTLLLSNPLVKVTTSLCDVLLQVPSLKPNRGYASNTDTLLIDSLDLHIENIYIFITSERIADLFLYQSTFSTAGASLTRSKGFTYTVIT